MKVFLRQFLILGTLTTLIVTLPLGFLSGHASAWTQENNFFFCPTPNSGVGCTGNPVCGQDQADPCIAWAQGNNQSITVHVYVDPSMYTQGFDFRPAVNGAISNFNSAPAWNPFYSACFSSGCGPVSYTFGPTELCAGGITFPQWGTAFQSSGQWFAPMTRADIVIENDITWNTNLQFNCNASGGTYDARTVVAHEMGHSQGLGHTGHSPALMMSGETCCFTLQGDDINGLQAVYPGHWPA